MHSYKMWFTVFYAYTFMLCKCALGLSLLVSPRVPPENLTGVSTLSGLLGIYFRSHYLCAFP